MNILFVSSLSGNLSVGPSYSVPAQIKAQSKVDNVFWLNITDSFREEWVKMGIPYLSGRKYKNITLREIIDTFTLPDVVFFEGCYNYPFFGLIKEVQDRKIPYLLVPRSQLTEGAQNNKALKKRIMNHVYFNRFINGASAIQYLTKSEAEDSAKWKPRRIIIPNGITQREYTAKAITNKSDISIVYIGRIDIYQKGLDLLIEACSKIKETLEKNGVTVSLYGQATQGDLEKLQRLSAEYGLGNILSMNNPVFGEEKFAVLEATDLFIMTSRFEGLPMGLIEALSFSCPCLVTKGTNMADEIQEHSAGWTLPNDIDGIAEAIESAITELPECYEVKAKNAYELSQKYMWDDIAVRTHQLCEELI